MEAVDESASGSVNLFPEHPYLARARQVVPGASFRVLEDVGHVPMLDDPGLVAETILEAAGEALDGRKGQRVG